MRAAALGQRCGPRGVFWLPGWRCALDSVELLDQLETQFALGVRRVEVVKQTSRSRVYELHGASGNAFLKVYLGGFPAERLAEEIGLLEYLNEREFKAPTVVKDRSGRSVFECVLDGAPARGYLTEQVLIARHAIDLSDERELCAAAARLGEFHSATGGLGREFTVVNWTLGRLIDRNVRTVEPLFAGRPDDFQALAECFEGVKARISAAWDKSGESWGIVHGDLHAENVVVGTDGQVWMLDFESFGNGFRISDVVHLLGSGMEAESPLDLAGLRDRYRVFMHEYARGFPASGEAAPLPSLWFAVRMVLQLGRRLREGALDPSQRDVLADTLLKNTRLLIQDAESG